MGNGRTATAATGARRGTVTVDVTDELDIATTPALQRAVEGALRGRPREVVVDLSRCAFVGVDALGVLVALSASARRQGTALTLVGLGDVTRQAIAMLSLEDVLACRAPEPHQPR